MKSITFSFSRIQINISSKMHEAFPNTNSIWNIIRVLRTSASWVNKLQVPANYSDYNYVFPAASKMQNLSIATKSNWLQTCSRQESLSPFSWKERANPPSQRVKWSKREWKEGKFCPKFLVAVSREALCLPCTYKFPDGRKALYCGRRNGTLISHIKHKTIYFFLK